MDLNEEEFSAKVCMIHNDASQDYDGSFPNMLTFEHVTFKKWRKQKRISKI